jgi:hypothetical protein
MALEAAQFLKNMTPKELFGCKAKLPTGTSSCGIDPMLAQVILQSSRVSSQRIPDRSLDKGRMTEAALSQAFCVAMRMGGTIVSLVGTERKTE